MCGSDYFKEQLTLNDQAIVEIKLDEFDADSVEAFVDWLYLGWTKNTEHYANDLFKLAFKYEIHDLKVSF